MSDDKQEPLNPVTDDQGGEFVEFPFPTFYTNSISVSATYFDVSLLVADMLNPAAKTIRARIVMVPAHAKLLVGALAQQVESYESKWGTIALPAKPKSSASSEPEPQS